MNKMLEDVGRPVLLGVMAIGFMWFWPIGLAVLAYLAWTGMLGNKGGWSFNFWSSGNSAFDKHQAEARAALEKERDDFRAYIAEKLTEKDQAEFADFSSKRKAA